MKPQPAIQSEGTRQDEKTVKIQSNMVRLAAKGNRHAKAVSPYKWYANRMKVQVKPKKTKNKEKADTTSNRVATGKHARAT